MNDSLDLNRAYIRERLVLLRRTPEVLFVIQDDYCLMQTGVWNVPLRGAYVRERLVLCRGMQEELFVIQDNTSEGNSDRGVTRWSEI